MTVQGELLNGLREHDLPPFWDGLAVVWEDWQPPWPDAFVCPPPPPSCCPACGCQDAQVTNRGRVAREHDHHARADPRAGRRPCSAP